MSRENHIILCLATVLNAKLHPNVNYFDNIYPKLICIQLELIYRGIKHVGIWVWLNCEKQNVDSYWKLVTWEGLQVTLIFVVWTNSHIEFSLVPIREKSWWLFACRISNEVTHSDTGVASELQYVVPEEHVYLSTFFWLILWGSCY